MRVAHPSRLAGTGVNEKRVIYTTARSNSCPFEPILLEGEARRIQPGGLLRGVVDLEFEVVAEGFPERITHVRVVSRVGDPQLYDKFNRMIGAEAGIRTPTVLPPLDPESSASAKFRHFGTGFRPV